MGCAYHRYTFSHTFCTPSCKLPSICNMLMPARKFYILNKLFSKHVKSGVCGSLSCVSKTFRLAPYFKFVLQLI